MREQLFEIEEESGLIDVARALQPLTEHRKVVCFYGPMGAGKTTLIKVFCKLVGVSDEMSSPTFAIVNEYRNKEVPIYHFDFYRITEETEALDLGYEDYFYSGHLCLVEWPEKIPNLLPENVVTVSIEINSGKRFIKLLG